MHVPVFSTRHVLVKPVFGAIWVLSGIVTSAVNWALSVQPDGAGVSEGAAVAVAVWLAIAGGAVFVILTGCVTPAGDADGRALAVPSAALNAVANVAVAAAPVSADGIRPGRKYRAPSATAMTPTIPSPAHPRSNNQLGLSLSRSSSLAAESGGRGAARIVRLGLTLSVEAGSRTVGPTVDRWGGGVRGGELGAVGCRPCGGTAS